ncbi:hypothetical protein [Bacillus sonorensis]|uniref:hypothetical protein n=1 Tax=Bacillus sonorensis TaxID=119858 RepID=UPI000344C15F|nr:hypothetical protein [Bacillus sonorensis]TWK79066.1 hypothetical protein CHCC20335_2004 [Bacillus paralicheniformis]GIN66605.1 hypothetical protein J41TS2_20260 [Bacillus sonorensis]
MVLLLSVFRKYKTHAIRADFAERRHAKKTKVYTEGIVASSRKGWNLRTVALRAGPHISNISQASLGRAIQQNVSGFEKLGRPLMAAVWASNPES